MKESFFPPLNLVDLSDINDSNYPEELETEDIVSEKEVTEAI